MHHAGLQKPRKTPGTGRKKHQALPKCLVFKREGAWCFCDPVSSLLFNPFRVDGNGGGIESQGSTLGCGVRRFQRLGGVQLSGLMEKMGALDSGVFTPGWVVGRFQRLDLPLPADFSHIYALLTAQGIRPVKYRLMFSGFWDRTKTPATHDCLCTWIFPGCSGSTSRVPPPPEGDRGWVP